MNFKRDNAWIFRHISQFQISLVFVIMLNLGPLQVEASLNRLIGCFKDYNNRVLSGNTTDLDPNGRNECKQYCQGYRYFGTESGEECFCGNKIKFYNRTASCTYTCEGNPDEYCGGHWKIMIYDTQTYENTSTTSSTEISASTHHVTETSKSTSQKPSTNHDTLPTHKPVRKTNTGDDKTPVSYLYILLPVGIVVIAVILVIIFCKRRLRCKKDSDPVASNSVVYAAPYSTAYLTPVHETELEHTSEMRSGNVNDANIGNDVYDRAGNYTGESENYNVINLRSNNKTVHNDSYDTLQEHNACSPGDSNTIYNKLKSFNSGNRNKSELLYDQTDKGSLESNTKRHSVHNDIELVQGFDEDKKKSVKDNIYANEDGYSN